jgi:putative nucleotidyltransferase with HDIG domain
MGLAKQSVLFIDDEPNILKAIKRMLRGEDWDVHCVTRPSDAFSLVNRRPFQVVVTDQRMPEMSGAQFLSALREQKPEIVRLMMTGFSELAVAVAAINHGEVFRFITKPWNHEEFKATIRQAFDHFELRRQINHLSEVAREQNRRLHDMNRSLESKVRDRTKQLAEKHAELSTAYIQTIRALAEAVDAKDPYTRGHSERVGVYASKLARELEVPRREIERIYIAGLLHDVGKIGIPDEIIAKPASLDEAEYELMKRHPEIGAKILEPVEFLADVVPCVRHHHEWFDGSDYGYPAGICGDRIPFPSRVILVADTVEAMTSDRPYRQAMGLDAVARELHLYSGTQFDPVCAEAMLQMLEREGEGFLRKNSTFDIHEFLGG